MRHADAIRQLRADLHIDAAREPDRVADAASSARRAARQELVRIRRTLVSPSKLSRIPSAPSFSAHRVRRRDHASDGDGDEVPVAADDVDVAEGLSIAERADEIERELLDDAVARANAGAEAAAHGEQRQGGKRNWEDDILRDLITDGCCSAPPPPSRGRRGSRRPARPSGAACRPWRDRAAAPLRARFASASTALMRTAGLGSFFSASMSASRVCGRQRRRQRLQRLDGLDAHALMRVVAQHLGQRLAISGSALPGRSTSAAPSRWPASATATSSSFSRT